MKILTITLLIVMFMLQPVQAGPGKHKDNGKHLERLTNELQLNEEQIGTVTQILGEQREKARSIFDQYREQAKPRFKALHEETRQRLSTVLSADQLLRFDEMSEKRRARKGFGGHRSK